MPVISTVILGKVTSIWGSAHLKLASGRTRVLAVGDTVRPHDVILTGQDGIVEIRDEHGLAKLSGQGQWIAETPTGARAKLALAADETIDRVIAQLEQGDPAAATAAGATAGSGGEVAPALRVDRVAESIGAGTLGIEVPSPTVAARVLEDGSHGGEVLVARAPDAPNNEGAPRARPSAVSGAEDAGAIAVNLSGSGAGGGPTLPVTVLRLPTAEQGILFLADGVTPVVAGSVLSAAEAAALVFVPTANFHGTVNIVFIVTDVAGVASAPATATVVVVDVNDAPLAQATSASGSEDQMLAVGLTGNDVDGTMVGYTITLLPAGCSLFLADGATQVLAGQFLTAAQAAALLFVAPAGWSGTANLSFTATDDAGAVSQPAQLTITIGAVNDAPLPASSALSVAEGSSDTPLGLAAPSDIDGDALTITVTGLPTVGVVTLANGTAVASGQVLTGTELAGLRFVAPADLSASTTTSFGYSVSDGTVAVSAGTTITVAAVNDAPVAVADSLLATEDTPVTYTAAQLIGNDTDVDSALLTIASVTSGAGGTAVLNANGTVTFTPNANFNGAADFSYTTTDGSLTSNTATVTVTVAAVNDAPVAVADSLSATEDSPVTYTAAQLLGNDTDVDSALLTIASVTSGAGGTAVLNANGTVTFTPNANFNGAAGFS